MALLFRMPSFIGLMQVATRIWSISCIETFMVYFSFMKPSSSSSLLVRRPINRQKRDRGMGIVEPENLLIFSSENVKFRASTTQGDCTSSIVFNSKPTTSNEKSNVICCCCTIIFLFPCATNLIVVMLKYYI